MQKTYFYGADKSEYAGVPYSNLAGATFVYRRSGGAAVTIKAQELFSDGEYYFDCQDSENAPMLSGGVLTLSARRTEELEVSGRERLLIHRQQCPVQVE